MKIDEFDTTAPFSPLTTTDLTRFLLVGFDIALASLTVAPWSIGRGLTLIDKTRGLTLK